MRVNAVAFFLFWLKRDSVANELVGRLIGTSLSCTNFLFWLKRESVANELNGRPIGTALDCAIFFILAQMRQIFDNIVNF